MKALVDEAGRICEVRAEPFPVAATLKWIDVADDVTTDHVLKDGRVETPPPREASRRLVPKRVIVDRLQVAGLLEAARKALDSADLYTRERWNCRDAIYSDDPTANALLNAIGADPDVILG